MPILKKVSTRSLYPWLISKTHFRNTTFVPPWRTVQCHFSMILTDCSILQFAYQLGSKVANAWLPTCSWAKVVGMRPHKASKSMLLSWNTAQGRGEHDTMSDLLTILPVERERMNTKWSKSYCSKTSTWKGSYAW